MKTKILLSLLMTLLSFGLTAQNTIYVKANASGSNNGTSWTDAYTNFQTAVNAASSGKEVWVAVGTYQPTVSGEYFSMKEGVKIYGGFVGNESNLSDRNWEAHVATLQGNGNSVIRNENNNLTTASILDGFTITGGNSTDGGGISNSEVSPSFSNLIITNNTATGYSGGGGVYNYNGTPTFSYVIISNNSATDNFGGGITNIDSSPILTNVILFNNTAGIGGGMYNDQSSSPTIINTTITKNNVTYDGGGMYNYSTASPVLYNTIIAGNSSGIYGNINELSTNNLIQIGDADSGGTPDGTGEMAIFYTSPTDIFKYFAEDDYTLKTNSYATNRGDNSKYTGNINTDLDLAGNPRLFQGTIDLGAYESQVGMSVLAVSLLDFNAKANGKDVKLNWHTSLERNNKGFSIERSLDGVVFQAIGYVAGTNTSQPTAYSFTDRQVPTGKLYYRLNIEDHNGTSAYSKVITVAGTLQSELSLLYPNPVKEVLHFKTPNPGKVLQIFNAGGALVLQKQITNKETAMNVSALATGVYTYRYGDEKGKIVKE